MGNGSDRFLLYKTLLHGSHFFLPEWLTYFFMNTLIGKNSKLSVFKSYVYQHTVMVFGLVHFQGKEYLRGPVERINITATILHKYPHFSASLLLCCFNSIQNGLLFLGRKEFFSPRKRK